jgi:hypothetical protein
MVVAESPRPPNRTVSPRCTLALVFWTIGGRMRLRMIPIASSALRKFDVTEVPAIVADQFQRELRTA